MVENVTNDLVWKLGNDGISINNQQALNGVPVMRIVSKDIHMTTRVVRVDPFCSVTITSVQGGDVDNDVTKDFEEYTSHGTKIEKPPALIDCVDVETSANNDDNVGNNHSIHSVTKAGASNGPHSTSYRKYPGEFTSEDLIEVYKCSY